MCVCSVCSVVIFEGHSLVCVPMGLIGLVVCVCVCVSVCVCGWGVGGIEISVREGGEGLIHCG